MVGLLGQRDELLRTVEAAFDDTRIHVRGNEITVEGPEAERVGRLFEELVALLQQGHWLDPTNVGHTIEMVKDDVRPSEVYNAEAGRSARGRKVHPKTAGQKALRRRHRRQHHHLRDRPRRHGQVVPRRRPRRAGAAGQRGGAHHPDAARGRGRGDGSASSRATSWPRSTRTCARSTTPSTTCSSRRAPSGSWNGGRSRSPRSPSCAAAP